MEIQQKQTILKWKDKQNATIMSSSYDRALQNVTAKKGVVQNCAAVLDCNKSIGVLIEKTPNFKVTKCNVKVFINIIRRYSDTCWTLYD
jgi:hypothetical protein